MNIVEAMKAFIASCPFIDTFSKGVHVDYTGPGADEYGVMSNGMQTLNAYVDGSLIKQYNFTLFARRYTVEDVQRLENIGFFESFSNWVETKNRYRDLPIVEGIVPMNLSVANGMLYDQDANGKTGLYQIQIQYQYYQTRSE